MAQQPRLNLRRLARDTVTAPGARRGVLAPGGRPATGLMAAVRDNLDALLALKAEGRSWAAIAAGLTAQGFATADGRAIDERNLTGVISSVRKQAKRHAAKDALRRGRDDVSAAAAVPAVPDPVPGRLPPRPTLSPDLVTTSAAGSPRAGRSEDERRRAALARAQSLLKKD